MIQSATSVLHNSDRQVSGHASRQISQWNLGSRRSHAFSKRSVRHDETSPDNILSCGHATVARRSPEKRRHFLMRILRIAWNVYLITAPYCVLSPLSSERRKIMKHALIGSLSVLAMIAGTAAANAQANINPNIYPTYRGAPVAQQPSEWYATPGPVRRGNMCAVDVDAGRGYGYMKPCPAPQAAPRVAHRAHRKTVVR